MLTESEAWEAIADLYPHYLDEHGGHAQGLCSMSYAAWKDGAISWETLLSMADKIDARLERRHHPIYVNYLWEPRLVPPRVRLARKFAKETKG